jgi:transcriptional regulator with XRE-family HTH domain
MSVMSSASRQKSWRTGRERVSVLAALALHKESVSRKLLQIREENRDPTTGKPLSQERAAARVHATSRTWQRWESGETVPYPRNLEAIAIAFGFDVGEFFDGDEEVVSADDARRALGPTQLDRIEAKLDRLLGQLDEDALATAIHLALEQAQQPSEGRGRGDGGEEDPGAQAAGD